MDKKNLGPDILRLRQENKTYKEISSLLGCAISTVAYYCGENQRVKTRARGRKRINKKRAYVQEVKNQAVCVDCLENYPYWVLQFDHVRGEKKADVSRMTQLPVWSMEDLVEEIAKCDIVCANCHTTRTHMRRLNITGGGDDLEVEI